MLSENAKMIAGAVSTLVVLLLTPYIPELGLPETKGALEVVVGVIVVAASVWFTPNKPKAS